MTINNPQIVELTISEEDEMHIINASMVLEELLGIMEEHSSEELQYGEVECPEFVSAKNLEACMDFLRIFICDNKFQLR